MLPRSLRYSDPSEPGITRKLRRSKWQYFNPDGSRIVEVEEIARLNKLGVPPAYRDVWFSPDPDGHLQAIGIDVKGRKQYRYHEDFRSHREAAKYDKCASFAQALPLVRARVAEDIAARGLGRDKVIAAIVRLLDSGKVRIGNEGYAQENDSYGATTLRTDHSAVRGSTVKLEYRGKSGKDQKVRLNDAALARIVKRCQDLPGQALFQYVGDDGEPHRIGSADVNAYVQAAMGEEFSAKHFRTWGASVIAFETIHAARHPLTLKELLQPVADALGNTPAISRKSYVHPLLLELVKEGRALDLAGAKLPRETQWLTRYERGLIGLLEA